MFVSLLLQILLGTNYTIFKEAKGFPPEKFFQFNAQTHPIHSLALIAPINESSMLSHCKKPTLVIVPFIEGKLERLREVR